MQPDQQVRVCEGGEGAREGGTGRIHRYPAACAPCSHGLGIVRGSAESTRLHMSGATNTNKSGPNGVTVQAERRALIICDGWRKERNK